MSAAKLAAYDALMRLLRPLRTGSETVEQVLARVIAERAEAARAVMSLTDAALAEHEPRSDCLDVARLDEFWTLALHELAPYQEEAGEPLLDTLRHVVGRLNSCLNALNRLSVDPAVTELLVELESYADAWASADAKEDADGRKFNGAHLFRVARRLKEQRTK